jgi:hypothetical protein
MENPWVLCGIGFLFCMTGVYLFYRNSFEEGKNILRPVLLMIAGVVLVGIGTARYFNISF